MTRNGLQRASVRSVGSVKDRTGSNGPVSNGPRAGRKARSLRPGWSTNDIALVLVALLSVLVTSVRSVANYDTSAARSYNSGWLPAKATWYGAPTGAGPNDNGGACGFKNVNQYPFSSMTSCGNEPLFDGGAGCGSCYE
ncbi:expansin-B6-like, partial [Triticum aestivum]